VKLADLRFERPESLFAHEPPERRGAGRDDVRLLVSKDGVHTDARFEDLPSFLRRGDLLVVNESATIPASLSVEGRLGQHLLNLCTRFAPDLWLAEPRWSPSKPGPMAIEPGDELRGGALRIRLLSPYPGIPRLWFAQADRPFEEVRREVAGPIHYGYAQAFPLDVYQTAFSRVEGSVEMPSAARPITLRVLRALAKAGIRVAAVRLHTGVSSLEIEEATVEAQALYPEPFRVGGETARLVNATHAAGGRVIAVGTTVVRALESAAGPEGVRASQGFTRLYVNPSRGVRAVDGLLTGLHDPVTSHLAMLSALVGIDAVKDAYAHAVRERYLWHEFGDSHLILPADGTWAQ
jgi:S-adenosylmethionine:tRNA ribosyltransferase-isomerase